MDVIQLLIAATGLLGHLFIARKNHIGYWFWIIGNLLTIYVSWSKELYILVGLFVIYTVISLVAIHQWKNHSPRQGLNCCRSY